MKQENIEKISILALIGLAAVCRILPHPANVTPIAAMALFGGAKLPLKKSIFVVFSAMLLSDLFLGFHESMAAVYLGLLITIFIGAKFCSKGNVTSLAGSTLLASIVFYALTNFSVWMFTAIYPKTISGLVASYTAAIPFFRSSLFGDLFYVAVIFGLYHLVEVAGKKRQTA